MSWVILVLVLIIVGYVIYRTKVSSQFSPEKIKELTAEQMKEIDKEIARLSQQGDR
jgi:hypothetical protein